MTLPHPEHIYIEGVKETGDDKHVEPHKFTQMGNKSSSPEPEKSVSADTLQVPLVAEPDKSDSADTSQLTLVAEPNTTVSLETSQLPLVAEHDKSTSPDASQLRLVAEQDKSSAIPDISQLSVAGTTPDTTAQQKMKQMVHIELEEVCEHEMVSGQQVIEEPIQDGEEEERVLMEEGIGQAETVIETTFSTEATLETEQTLHVSEAADGISEMPQDAGHGFDHDEMVVPIVQSTPTVEADISRVEDIDTPDIDSLATLVAGCADNVTQSSPRGYTTRSSAGAVKRKLDVVYQSPEKENGENMESGYQEKSISKKTPRRRRQTPHRYRDSGKAATADEEDIEEIYDEDEDYVQPLKHVQIIKKEIEDVANINEDGSDLANLREVIESDLEMVVKQELEKLSGLASQAGGRRGISRGRPGRAGHRNDRTHMKRPHYKREQNVKCPFCPAKLKDYHSVFDHAKLKHIEDPKYGTVMRDIKQQMRVVCEVCDKEISNREQLAIHMTTMHQDHAQAKCGICGIVVKSDKHMRGHKLRVHGSRSNSSSYLCHLCPASFKQQSYLTAHIKYVHTTNSGDAYPCDMCDKKYANEKYLYNHKLRVHGAKKYVCKYCSKDFTNMPNLKRHIFLLHERTAEKPHQCSQCGKRFTLKSNLKDHIQTIHRKIYKVRCEVCDAGFRRQKELYSHKLSVHGSGQNVFVIPADKRFSRPVAILPMISPKKQVELAPTAAPSVVVADVVEDQAQTEVVDDAEESVQYIVATPEILKAFGIQLDPETGQQVLITQQSPVKQSNIQ